MKKLLFLAVAIVLIIGLVVLNVNKKYERNLKRLEQDTIELSFMPQPATEVDSIEFDSNWILHEIMWLENIAGVEQILVAFYEVSEGRIKFILQDKHGFYDLGMEGRPEDVVVLAKDINKDGSSELLISVNQGATVKEVKIFTYKGEQWLSLLDGENFIDVDLDEDGISEIVETSMGSLPGYTYLYRWNGGQFEKSDLMKDSGYDHVAFVIKQNKPVFELVKGNIVQIYAYQKGKLEVVLGK